MKKVVFTLTMAISLVFILLTSGCSKEQSFTIDDPTTLTIQCGSEITEITDPESINRVTEHIESLVFKRGESSKDWAGWDYWLKWYDDESELIFDAFICGKTLNCNGYFWNSENGKIDIELLDAIIKAQEASAKDILSAVYGEHFWVDEAGNYNSLMWPDNTELGVCNLDLTEKHAVLDTVHFSLTSDKAVYNQGEAPVLTLTAHTSGGFGWEYDIEQEIDGRWYWLNSMAGWEATLRTMEPGDQIEIEVNPKCGWYLDGIPQYQLTPGSYRIVVPVMIEAEQPDEYERAYVACDILIR